MVGLFEPYRFANGMLAKNRLVLAPLTNGQSHEDGTLSSEEFRWLAGRAHGGFSMIETAAAYVQKDGKGFPGQLGIHDDYTIAGLRKLTAEIKKANSMGMIQLYHGGARSPKDVTNTAPISPSHYVLGDGGWTKEMTLEMIQKTKTSFVQAAVRAYKAGFQGIELHAAHAYLIAQFLSPIHNHREDEYGGSFTNRCRLLLEIIDEIKAAVRQVSDRNKTEPKISDLNNPEESPYSFKHLDLSQLTSDLNKKSLKNELSAKSDLKNSKPTDLFSPQKGHPFLPDSPQSKLHKTTSTQEIPARKDFLWSDFLMGVRISPENHGIDTREMLELSEILYSKNIDFLSVSFWDVNKKSADYPSEKLLDLWTKSKSSSTALMVAGKLTDTDIMKETLNKGADLLAVGRMAIGNSNMANDFLSGEEKTHLHPPPWSRAHLEDQGVSTPFWNYLSRRFPDLVSKIGRE